MSKPSKQRLLDMFDRVLPSVDRRERNFYDKLSDDEKKEFSPWLVQRYLSSSNSDQKTIEHYLIMTNNIVNVKDIKDPELMWKLMCIVGTGKKCNHPFISPPKQAKYENAFKEWLSKMNPGLDQQEIEILFGSFDKKKALDMLDQFQVKDKKVIKDANDL